MTLSRRNAAAAEVSASRAGVPYAAKLGRSFGAAAPGHPARGSHSGPGCQPGSADDWAKRKVKGA
jgi:hypothetical protein